MSLVSNNDIILDGVGVKIYQDNYPNYKGLACYGTGPHSAQHIPPAKWCFGIPNQVSPCASVTEHINNYMARVKALSQFNGYGMQVGRTVPMWPDLYLNPLQADQFRREIAGGVIKGPTVAVYPNGCNCVKCNLKNEYAIPNQKDGTYVCYMCRR